MAQIDIDSLGDISSGFKDGGDKIMEKIKAAVKSVLDEDPVVTLEEISAALPDGFKVKSDDKLLKNYMYVLRKKGFIVGKINPATNSQVYIRGENFDKMVA